MRLYHICIGKILLSSGNVLVVFLLTREFKPIFVKNLSYDQR
jgi:hypothetical protein